MITSVQDWRLDDLAEQLQEAEEHHRALGEQFARTVRTGVSCTYGAYPAPAWVR